MSHALRGLFAHEIIRAHKALAVSSDAEPGVTNQGDHRHEESRSSVCRHRRPHNVHHRLRASARSARPVRDSGSPIPRRDIQCRGLGEDENRPEHGTYFHPGRVSRACDRA